MPFIRQSRDKRGFEQTVVLHTYQPGGNASTRPRVLYLFRSPLNLRVGRTALDAEVMEALEHTHPDLSFDWGTLTRDASRTEAPPDRPARRPSRDIDRRDSERQKRPPVVVSAPPPVTDDGSVLSRTLGASEAVRLRQRYSELLQRVGRRARSTEERDRLFDRARRLNPDDWSDEPTIRASFPGIEAAWSAIAAELPSRRRGRRGSRRPEGERPSGIMTPSGEDGETSHASAPSNDEIRADVPDSGGDGGSLVGPILAAESDPPGDD